MRKNRGFRFLRRITYYPGSQQQDTRHGIRLTRDTFNIRGPVTAIEGPALLERIGDEGRSASFSLPAFIDRVEFGLDGKVIATTRWDGDPQPQNTMISEQFDYDQEGILRGRTVRNIHPHGLRSYALTGMHTFMLGDTLLPLARPLLINNQDSKRILHYDDRGRLIEERVAAGKSVVSDTVNAHAVCRYNGDSGLITLTGHDGKVNDRIRLDITRDRYGNVLSRRYTWELEGGAPSTRTEEVRYRLSYADEQVKGSEPGAEKSRGITVTGYNSLDNRELAITLSGPTPARLSPGLLPLSSGMQVLYATEMTAGWFSLPPKSGDYQATEIGNTDPRTAFVSAITGAIGPTAQQGMAVLEWDHSRTAGTVWSAWQLAFHPVTAIPGGMQRASSVPWSVIRQDGMGSPTSLPVDIRRGHRNPQLVWHPGLKRYLMVAENHEQSMPGITLATVNTDGTLATSQALRFRGYSPRLAKTRDGIALCFVQRNRSADKGSIRFSTSTDGKQWAQSRQLFPQLTPKEVALTGDGHGTLYLLVLCHRQMAAVGHTTPATLYGVISRDDGKTWARPKELASYQSEYDDEPSICLAIDNTGKPWIAFSELGERVDTDPGFRYDPGIRSSARMVIGSW